MKVEGISRRTIEPLPTGLGVRILDQTLLPHEIVWRDLHTMEEAAEAIRVMQVRGAPLIGATAGYGLAMGLREDASNIGLETGYKTLLETRPTAVNLRWALDRMRAAISPLPESMRAQAAWEEAGRICEDDVAANATIGRHGLRLLRELAEVKGESETLHIMTHCNAGWLGCVDWGTALSPIYQAHDAGMRVHVWVSETRPRNQGASLTAWELRQHQVPFTLIVDNEAGHLLQRGFVDLCIVGTDRVAANGDVANKIGTYLKALAARASRVPFYVACPFSTIDWSIRNGIREIPIEQRSGREVTHIAGRNAGGHREEVQLSPEGAEARNDGFDVTPARLVSALITEHGVYRASAADLRRLKTGRKAQSSVTRAGVQM